MSTALGRMREVMSTRMEAAAYALSNMDYILLSTTTDGTQEALSHGRRPQVPRYFFSPDGPVTGPRDFSSLVTPGRGCQRLQASQPLQAKYRLIPTSLPIPLPLCSLVDLRGCRSACLPRSTEAHRAGPGPLSLGELSQGYTGGHGRPTDSRLES